MAQAKSPVACTLNDKDLQNRLKLFREKLLPHVVGKAELEHGQALSFPEGRELCADIERLIELENECCSFLDFELSSSSETNQMTLKVTGPEGTKGFLAEVLT